MKKFLLLLVFVFAILERVFYDLGPNVELVTLAALIGGAYLRPQRGFLFTFLIMAVTDILIGNTSIFLFTWSGMGFAAIVSGVVLPRYKENLLKFVGVSCGLGVSSVLVFYLWTNFGVWITDSWGMYSNDLVGLSASYINGLPFLRLSLMSVILTVPGGVLVLETLSRSRLSERFGRVVGNLEVLTNEAK